MESSEKTAWLSILTNLLLVGIKTGVVVISGSLAVTADAIHSLSDVISSAIILIGIKISGRSSLDFPYGLYKVENMVAMVTSVLILFAGYEIIKAVFIAPSQTLPTQIPLSIVGIGATILITWLFSRYELKKGRETGSPSLIADARHIWTDMLSSMVIMMALLGSAIGFSLDKYAAIIVVLFIARSALTIFLDSVRVLLDASLDHNSLTRIREIVLADLRVAEINSIWARNAGRYKFVELDLTLRVRELEEGHRASEEIENRVKMEIAKVDRVLIHFQSRQQELLTFGIPLAEDRLTISEHFGEAPFFRLSRIQRAEGEIVEDNVLNNPYLHEEKAKGIKVAKWLLEHGLDVLISNHDHSGKGPGFVLGNGGAEILLTKESNAEKALTIVRSDLGQQIPDDIDSVGINQKNAV
ncbi:MAG: cation diffusion facilitator family transporter [Proteobacteria bacterium]|nr:cation diffusion facilitator family transporter [Pseudomonadota bacterium]MBU1649589.1 cation diffusion facilitator family transporter [Pseudomonadota bacterium]